MLLEARTRLSVYFYTNSYQTSDAEHHFKFKRRLKDSYTMSLLLEEKDQYRGILRIRN